MKNSTEKKTVDREELSRTFAICTCIGILLCMGLVMFLGGCSAASQNEPGEVISSTVTTTEPAGSVAESEGVTEETVTEETEAVTDETEAVTESKQTTLNSFSRSDVRIVETDDGWGIHVGDGSTPNTLDFGYASTTIPVNSTEAPEMCLSSDREKVVVNYVDRDTGVQKMFAFSIVDPDNVTWYRVDQYPELLNVFWQGDSIRAGFPGNAWATLAYPLSPDPTENTKFLNYTPSFKGYGKFDPDIPTTLGYPAYSEDMQYIKAFLNGNVERMLELCSGYPDENAFDLYSTLKFGNYEIFMEEEGLSISFELLESGIDRLKPGTYERIPTKPSQSGCYLDFGYSSENRLDLTEEESVCTSYIRQFCLEMPAGIKDTTPLMNYLLGYVDNERVMPDAGTTIFAGLTKEDVDAIAMKLYGFTFEIPPNRLTESGEISSGYIPSGGVYYYNFTNMSADDDRITATVEFYSDQSCIAVCKIVTYDFVLRDGMWIIESIDIEDVLPIEPFRGRGL